MKTISINCLMGTCLVLVLACGARPQTKLARVDSEAIKVEDLTRAYRMHQVLMGELAPTLSAEDETRLKRRLLAELVDHRILLIQARSRGLTIDTKFLSHYLSQLRQGYGRGEFENQLLRRGLSVREWETIQQEKFLIQSWIQEEILRSIQIPLSELKTYYRKNASAFALPAQVRALHIVVDTREGAEEIRKQAVTGADFRQLARDYSQGPEAKGGGELGYFTRKDYPPVFTETCFKLKKGRLSAVIASDYGYHLFKVLDRRAKRKRSFTEVAPEIRDLLTRQKTQERMDAKLKELRDSMAIEIYEEALAEVRL